MDSKTLLATQDETTNLLMELELVPLARAMVGTDVKDAREINPIWCMRPESMKAYRKLKDIKDDSSIMSEFGKFAAEDEFMRRAIQNIGSDSTTESIAKKLKQEWIKRRENHYLQQLINAQSPEDKIHYANTIKRLYRAQSSKVYVVDMANPSPPADYLMIYDGISYRPKGDLSIIKAKAKMGKSTYLRIEIACMISESGQVLGMSRSLDQSGQMRKPYKVLWIDTEQSKASSDSSYRQVLQMAGLPLDANSEHLRMVNFRMMSSEERRKELESEIEHDEYDVVVLDGVKDIASDINNQAETDEIIELLLNLMQDHMMSFITIIHENPARDSDKMRGWLGSELGNKCFEVQEVKNNKDSGVFTVLNTDRRGKTIPAYGFRYNEQDQLEQCEPELSIKDGQGQGQNRSHKEIVLDNQTRYCNQVKKAFEDNPNLQHTHADLIRLLIKKCGLTKPTACNRIKVACDVGTLKVVQGEAGQRGAEYALAPQTQTELNILLSQKTTINEDGTIPDIFEQENGQLDDCPY